MHEEVSAGNKLGKSEGRHMYLKKYNQQEKHKLSPGSFVEHKRMIDEMTVIRTLEDTAHSFSSQRFA
jgi:hypothetical protein